VTVNLPRGAAGLHVPEFAVRAALKRGFLELEQDEEQQRQLATRVMELYGVGEDDEWLTDALDQFGRWFDPTTPEHVKIDIGYPWDAAVLPYVSIMNAQGVEDAGSAVMGDVQTKQGEFVYEGGVRRVHQHTVQGNEWTTRIQIGSWTRAPVSSILLHSMITQIVFGSKGQLAPAGILEMSLADGGVTPDRQLYPDTGYVPILTATLRWTRYATTRRDVPHFYTLETPIVGI